MRKADVEVLVEILLVAVPVEANWVVIAVVRPPSPPRMGSGRAGGEEFVEGNGDFGTGITAE